MVFPINVSKKIRDAGKTTGVEKFSAVLICMVIVNIIVFSQLQGLLGGIGVSPIVTILIQLLLSIIVGIFIVRFFVIREEDKYVEHERSKDSSLSNYFYIRNKENLETIETAPVFEYTDGNFCILIGITYGSNSDRKARGNRDLLTSLNRNVLKYGMQLRVFTMPERFSDSVECKTYLSNMVNIKDDSVREYMGEVINNALNYCENYSELLTTVIMIRTANPYQIQNMGTLIRQLLNEYATTPNSMRGLQFYGVEEMRAFMRDYYCLEALDLSSLKATEVDKDTLLEYRDLIKLHDLELKTGQLVKKNELKLRNGVKRVR